MLPQVALMTLGGALIAAPPCDLPPNRRSTSEVVPVPKPVEVPFSLHQLPLFANEGGLPARYLWTAEFLLRAVAGCVEQEDLRKLLGEPSSRGSAGDFCHHRYPLLAECDACNGQRW